jgi:nitrite reductase (cytochrome c-552)
LQRRAQWRLDYIAAENSMGFHAPQEAARILGEAIDFARQGQVAVLRRGEPPDTKAEGNQTPDAGTSPPEKTAPVAPPKPASQK